MLTEKELVARNLQRLRVRLGNIRQDVRSLSNGIELLGQLIVSEEQKLVALSEEKGNGKEKSGEDNLATPSG